MASASTRRDQKLDLQSLLECSICLETFDDPRTLPCLHSFCKKCLENFVNGKRDNDLNCPVCRTKFTISKKKVSGMTRNHFICNMVEVMSIQQQHKSIPCSHCQEPSVGRCVTCELFMCEKCLQSHNGYVGFRDHVVLTMEELSKPENQSKIRGRSYCKKHGSKKLKLYCETCEELICTYCMAFEHVRPDHLCSPLEEVAQKKRNDLMLICNTLENDQHNKFLTNFERDLETCEENLGQAKRKIDERKIEVLRFVRNIIERKTQLLCEEMDTIYRNRAQEIYDEIVRKESHFEEKEKTLNMAKALLDHGSDEEIVMSHESVQQNATKDYQCQWKEANVDIMKYDSAQLDALFLDDVRAIEKDTILVKSEKVGLRKDKTAWPYSVSQSPRLIYNPRTGKMIARSLDSEIAIKMAAMGFTCCDMRAEPICDQKET